ncbi:hypothetical protein C8R43DRAFT_1194406 [Mycena crocata]|nr:hypothetical protein C8R43DRAFT_1194406 [Mycena crocata]
MPHTPQVPVPIVCPQPLCGPSFHSPRDFQVHGQLHSYRRQQQKLACTTSGCSFKTDQLKHLEAHVASAHEKRQFQCIESRCGFSTTSQGALTRHYRERHNKEPPASGHKPLPPRRRAVRPKYADEPRTPGASMPRVSEPASSRFHSQEPAFSVSSASSPAMSTGESSDFSISTSNNKHYRAAAYYSASPPPSSGSTSPPHPAHLYMHTMRPLMSRSFPCPCPPAGPHNNGCEQYSQFSPPSHAPPSFSSAAWVSWRNDIDLTSEALAIATGERPYCERNILTDTTEYLPVEDDIGMYEDKRRLWAYN